MTWNTGTSPSGRLIESESFSPAQHSIAALVLDSERDTSAVLKSLKSSASIPFVVYSSCALSVVTVSASSDSSPPDAMSALSLRNLASVLAMSSVRTSVL